MRNLKLLLLFALIGIFLSCSSEEDPSGDCLCTRTITSFNPVGVVDCSLNYPIEVTQNFEGINESSFQEYNQNFDTYTAVNPSNNELIIGEQVITNNLMIDITKDFDLGKFRLQIKPQELEKDTIIGDFLPESYDEIIRQSSIELTIGGMTYTFDEDSDSNFEMTLTKDQILQYSGQIPYVIKIITELKYVEGNNYPIIPKEISIRTTQICTSFDPEDPENVEIQEYLGNCLDDGAIFMEGESFVRVSCITTN